jgi:hypothetical protein
MPSSTMRMLFRIHLLSLSTLLSLILLSTSLTVTSARDPRINASIEEARRWIETSKSREVQEEFLPCNVSPSLGYLRAQLHQLFLLPSVFDETHLSAQPLHYSFYLQHILQPYRSLLSEANAPSTAFCYANKPMLRCWTKEGRLVGCESLGLDTAVCLPNSDESTEGSCVSCKVEPHLSTALQAGKLSDAASIAHLKTTCNPKRPTTVPWRNPREKDRQEARWLRWFLQSSFVFEGKKVGVECSASPAMSKARSYVDVLMGKHFGRNTSEGNVDLATPGTDEGKEDELKYEGVRRELNDEKNKEFYKEKLKGIQDGKHTFQEIYCSREEGLVCVLQPKQCRDCSKEEVMGSCRSCGDEEVKKNAELREACHPANAGGGSTGAHEGKQIEEFAAVILGLVF